MGESMGPSQVLLQARAMRLQYHLEAGGGEENERSKAWMIHFLTEASSLEESLALKRIQVPSGWSLREARRRWEG